MFTYVFVTLSILQSQFIEKGVRKAEYSEQNVMLLLFLFTLKNIVWRSYPHVCFMRHFPNFEQKRKQRNKLSSKTDTQAEKQRDKGKKTSLPSPVVLPWNDKLS